MIEIVYLLKGFIIGFVVSAPMGPISILCIKRTLTEGRLQGYATGLGATASDLFYAILAIFGLSFAVDFLIREQFWFCLAGGLFLIALGVYIYRKKISYEKEASPSLHLKQSFTSGFLLNFSNPLILILFLAIFSGFGFGKMGDISHYRYLFRLLFLLVGFVGGATFWWFLLTEITFLFKRVLTVQGVQIVNKISAILVIFLGVLILISLVFPMTIFGITF